MSEFSILEELYQELNDNGQLELEIIEDVKYIVSQLIDEKIDFSVYMVAKDVYLIDLF